MHTIMSETIGFNPAAPTIMLMDINSCFATIEQQANPLLRGKPVVVGAYTTDKGFILAASREAKQLGIKMGLTVGEAKRICPNLVVIFPDSDKYRFINKKLQALIRQYSEQVEVKSIDEMAFVMTGMPALRDRIKAGMTAKDAVLDIAQEIKQRIKEEIGDWITVSIGIAPNRYLAKIGASYQKPDGLICIDKDNILDILNSMELETLCGIKKANGDRLRIWGIYTPLDMYNSSFRTLKNAFHSVVGYHWWLRLHGWEADDREFSRKTIGHQHALKKPLYPTDQELRHILYQLVVKMGRRLRTDKFTAQGIHVACYYRDYQGWGKSEKQADRLYADSDFYERAVNILEEAPHKLIRVLAVNCFDLQDNLYRQQSIFEEEDKRRRITQALDQIAERWGEFSVVPGRLINIKQKVHDRVGFGNKYSIDFGMRGVL